MWPLQFGRGPLCQKCNLSRNSDSLKWKRMNKRWRWWFSFDINVGEFVRQKCETCKFNFLQSVLFHRGMDAECCGFIQVWKNSQKCCRVEKSHGYGGNFHVISCPAWFPLELKVLVIWWCISIGAIVISIISFKHKAAQKISFWIRCVLVAIFWWCYNN